MTTLFSRLRQFWGDMKLQSKFTLVMMIAVTLPVLMMVGFFYSRLYDMVVSYTIRQEQDSSAQTAPLIEDIVDDIVNAHQELTETELYQTLFHQPVNSPFRMMQDENEISTFCETAQKLISGGRITGLQIYMDFPTDSVNLFHDERTKIYFSPMDKARAIYWYGIFQGTGVSSLYCPSFYLGDRERADYGDLAYITSTTFYYQGTAHQAYIAVYGSSDQLNAILKDNLKLDGSVSYIINDRNAVVASSDTSLSGIYMLNYETIEDSFMSSNNFIEREILDTTVYAGYYSIQDPGWFMVTILPSGPLVSQSNSIMIQYGLLYLGIIVITVFLAHGIARSITRRISSVIHQMSRVREGTVSSMESPVYHDEVGDLIDTYNYMTRRMNALIEDQKKAAEELRIAEFNSLQAQINPHFLYNTMDMINWQAQQGKTDDVSEAVQRLSRFYKLTLSRKESISTIAREEEHISIYLELMNMRYHNSISFVSDIPDEFLEYGIPKLTLQPVIENAVLHGILETEKKSGTIVLTGWMDGGDIVLLVSDDGIGIPPEKLQTILTGQGVSATGGTNIAVYNTHRRLQILYGENYGLHYSSEYGKGTDVQIRLPAKRKE